MTPGMCRAECMARDDQRCQARAIDPKAGPCRDREGHVVVYVPFGQLEMDYVRHGSHAKRHEDPRDHVMLCPGHHQGRGAQQGYVWATAHRAEMRAWLEER